MPEDACQKIIVRPERNITLKVFPHVGLPSPPSGGGGGGSSGSGLTAGPGLIIVGAEIRYDIESLTRG